MYSLSPSLEVLTGNLRFASFSGFTNFFLGRSGSLIEAKTEFGKKKEKKKKKKKEKVG